jgi:hypothetical protein
MRSWHYPGYDGYRKDAYFICDRCGQRHRRSAMITEWTNLKVDRQCLDPRPPQLMPPNVYPEGIPFFDARPPQDNPDRLWDDTTLYPVTGGIAATVGQLNSPSGQNLGPGALSPQNFVETVQIPVDLSTGAGGVISGFGVTETGTPQGPNVLEDDITFITGVVGAK